ncbi:uncharacterized protein NESG_00905 [Nematocida ausubeli]|uniref:Uncharacterized protein n=1 Tax=Nematocida ausubeli (strain ATCC PRA-371 / ERTm2) TaxID=1913371 RepID=A0A086J3N3_NEMA1|nr:uncharacterized protein NESG_00905 [Nematocida ausubeli]KFG26751.1 hypothetical protein NESG_00905 [Nematocida ausubeli]
MLSTVTYVNSSIAILNEKTLNIHKDGVQAHIDLPSKGLLVCGCYVITETKDILVINDGAVKRIGKSHKTPTKMAISGSSMYIADRAGSVYELEDLEKTCMSQMEGAPKHLFGSISMITDIIVSEDSIITADKDNKIRVTDRQYPHRIQSFIQVHSKPILSIATVGKYLVAGGYDWYVSLYNTDTKEVLIFDLMQNKIERMGKTLPGVDDPENISNINLDAESKVRKLLGNGNTLLILRNSTPILVDISKINENLEVTCTEISGLSDKVIIDGISMEDGFAVLDEQGFLFKIVPSAPAPTQILQIPNYTHKIDISIANKYLD